MARHTRHVVAGHRAAAPKAAPRGTRSSLGTAALVLAAAAVAVGTSGMLAMTAAQGSSPDPISPSTGGLHKVVDTTAPATPNPSTTPTPAVAGVSLPAPVSADAGPKTSTSTSTPKVSDKASDPVGPAAPATGPSTTPGQSAVAETPAVEPEASVPVDPTPPSAHPGLLGGLLGALR